MAIVIPRLNPAVLDPELHPELLPDRVLVIDITGSVVESDEYKEGAPLSPARIMGMIQRAWVLKPDRANKCDLFFACCRVADGFRQIIGVFKFSDRKVPGKEAFSEGFFHLDCDDENRYSFFAAPADDTTWNRYTGLFLPPRDRGEANPLRYYEISENQ